MARYKSTMKESFGSRLFDVINVLIMLMLVILVIIPLLHVVSASFSNPSDYVRHEGLLLKPANFSLEAYKAVARNKNLSFSSTAAGSQKP